MANKKENAGEIKLTSKQYQKFGEEFLKFYMENGFGSKSKADLDCCVYDALCEIGFVNDTHPALLIGRQLQATAATVTKCKEWRFVQHKIPDDALRQQLSDVLQENVKNETVVCRAGKLTFSVHSYAVKLYLEELLQRQKCNYDYSFSPSNISLTPQAFVCLLEQFNCDFDSSIDNFIKDKETQKILNEKKNIEIKNSITTTINSSQPATSKWLEICGELLKYAATGVTLGLIQHTIAK